MQGVFQISAVQPVRYVIEEVSDLFDVSNEVRALIHTKVSALLKSCPLFCSCLLLWRLVFLEEMC